MSPNFRDTPAPSQYLLALLDGFTVVHSMAHNEENRDKACYQGTDTTHDQGQGMKRDTAIPEVNLLDCRESVRRYPNARADAPGGK